LVTLRAPQCRLALRALLSFSSCPPQQFVCRWMLVGKGVEEVGWQDVPLLLRQKPVLGQCLRWCPQGVPSMRN